MVLWRQPVAFLLAGAVFGSLTGCKYFFGESEKSRSTRGSIMAGIGGMAESAEERRAVEFSYRLTCAAKDGTTKSVTSNTSRGDGAEELVNFEGLRAADISECWLDVFGPKTRANATRVSDCPLLEGDTTMYHYYASSKSPLESGSNLLRMKIFSLCRRALQPSEVGVKLDIALRGSASGTATWGSFLLGSARLVCDQGEYNVVAPIPPLKQGLLQATFVIPKIAMDGQLCRGVSLQLDRGLEVPDEYEAREASLVLSQYVLQTGSLGVVEVSQVQTQNNGCINFVMGACRDRASVSVAPNFPWVAVVQGWGAKGFAAGSVPETIVVSSRADSASREWTFAATSSISVAAINADLQRVAAGGEPQLSWYPLDETVVVWLSGHASDADLWSRQLTPAELRSVAISDARHLQRVLVKQAGGTWSEIPL